MPTPSASIGLSLGPSELDFDADAFPIEKDGAPCPVDWCTAHVHRHQPCGDPQGPFYGTHVGRVNRAKDGRWVHQMERRAERVLGAPVSPEMVHALVAIEDGLNAGLIVGPPTKAQRAQARARRNWKPAEHNQDE